MRVLGSLFKTKMLFFANEKTTSEHEMSKDCERLLSGFLFDFFISVFESAALHRVRAGGDCVKAAESLALLANANIFSSDRKHMKQNGSIRSCTCVASE